MPLSRSIFSAISAPLIPEGRETLEYFVKRLCRVCWTMKLATITAIMIIQILIVLSFYGLMYKGQAIYKIMKFCQYLVKFFGKFAPILRR